MNSIRLALSPTVADPADVGVAIWVDGKSLIDRVRRLEAPWWAEIGRPQSERQYVWVPARVALPPGRHLLGEPTLPWCGDHSAVVVCNCGECACRSFAVKIEVSQDRVAWTAWAEFPPEEARLGDALKPLTFDRSQYEAEISRVAEEFRMARRG